MRLLISSLLFLIGLSGFTQDKTQISPAEFESQISNDQVQILDVRTSEEFKSGYINNALHADWWNAASFKERVKYLDRNKTIYVYCASGGRSKEAAKYLRKNGYKVLELQGGTNLWKKEGKTLQSQAQVKELTVEEYKRMIPQEGNVLVDFGAPWCPPCRQMEPVLVSLEKANPDITIVKIEAGIHQNLEKELHIESLPTFIFYKNGVETGRRDGVISINEIINQFQAK